MKLVQREAESEALAEYLRRHQGDDLLTSALARVEVVRAVLTGGPPAVAKARRRLAALHQVNLDTETLDNAATLGRQLRPVLRSLDAIHLASAQLVADDLRVVVTYDRRMGAAAEILGLPAASPS